MAESGFAVVDLLNPQNVVSLIAQFKNTDTVSIAVNEELSQMLTDINAGINEVVNMFMKDNAVSFDEVINLIKIMQNLLLMTIRKFYRARDRMYLT